MANSVVMVKLAGPADLIYCHCTAQRLLENLRLWGMAFTCAEGSCPWFLQCSGCRFRGTGMNLFQTSQAIQSLTRRYFSLISMSVLSMTTEIHRAGHMKCIEDLELQIEMIV